jgi:hypothetical protein
MSFSRVVIATECENIIDDLCFDKGTNWDDKLFEEVFRAFDKIEKLGVDVEFWWVDKDSIEEASTLAREGASKSCSREFIPEDTRVPFLGLASSSGPAVWIT